MDTNYLDTLRDDLIATFFLFRRMVNFMLKFQSYALVLFFCKLTASTYGGLLDFFAYYHKSKSSKVANETKQ